MPRRQSQALAAGLKIRNNSSNPYQNTFFVHPYYLIALFPFLFFPFCFPLFGPNDRGKPENKGVGLCGRVGAQAASRVLHNALFFTTTSANGGSWSRRNT
jgi:hypothetical protein